jgi:hypothetical protein
LTSAAPLLLPLIAALASSSAPPLTIADFTGHELFDQLDEKKDALIEVLSKKPTAAEIATCLAMNSSPKKPVAKKSKKRKGGEGGEGGGEGGNDEAEDDEENANDENASANKKKAPAKKAKKQQDHASNAPGWCSMPDDQISEDMANDIAAFDGEKEVRREKEV